MKTNIIHLTLMIAILAFTASCNHTQKAEQAETHEHHDSAEEESKIAEATAPQFEVDNEFQEQLGSLFTSYVQLKDALVASNAPDVKASASKTKDALKNVDMKLLSGQAHNDWMAYLAPMESALTSIESSTDIEEQRKSFSTLSDNFYKSIKAFGLGGKEAFYEYCPMAFNNEGAYWLSDQEKIRNPYFGDKMLTCGEVKEKLR